MCHEIFDLQFFSWFEPIWAPDKQAKVFSNSEFRIRKYFSVLIRGPDGFESWKKLGVENLVTHSLECNKNWPKNHSTLLLKLNVKHIWKVGKLLMNSVPEIGEWFSGLLGLIYKKLWKAASKILLFYLLLFCFEFTFYCFEFTFYCFEFTFYLYFL